MILVRVGAQPAVSLPFFIRLLDDIDLSLSQLNLYPPDQTACTAFLDRGFFGCETAGMSIQIH